MTDTPIVTVTALAAMIADGDKIVVADCRFDPFAPEAGPPAYALPGVARSGRLTTRRTGAARSLAVARSQQPATSGLLWLGHHCLRELAVAGTG
jgi:hypothetical protein